MKKLFYLAMTAIMSVGMVSCGPKEKDEPTIEEEKEEVKPTTTTTINFCDPNYQTSHAIFNNVLTDEYPDFKLKISDDYPVDYYRVDDGKCLLIYGHWPDVEIYSKPGYKLVSVEFQYYVGKDLTWGGFQRKRTTTGTAVNAYQIVTTNEKGTNLRNDAVLTADMTNATESYTLLDDEYGIHLWGEKETCSSVKLASMTVKTIQL